ASPGASIPALRERTARITPSPPMPARRSARAATAAASRSSRPSGSSTTTKSFSVPWPLVNSMRTLIPRSLRPLCTSRRDRRLDPRDRLLDEHVPGIGLEPADPLVAAEPGVLLPHQAACARDRLLDRLLAAHRAVEHRQALLVADRPAGGAPRVPAPRPQGTHLREQTLLDHAVHPCGDPLVQQRAVHPQAQLHGGGVVVVGARQEGGEGAPGELTDLERAHDAARVPAPD